ncbi:sulfated surface glycoprotein 185-like [Helianthus annuus]|uniref:sulfated surface glycoprotein 185-like n=1 Tax=Helianthus annuus TaxID=4232 RepID=UPI000B8F718F|nr:sulfated surface glycoprotein 185-like [Helianthus annuus]
MEMLRLEKETVEQENKKKERKGSYNICLGMEGNDEIDGNVMLRSTSEPLMSAPCRPRADIRTCLEVFKPLLKTYLLLKTSPPQNTEPQPFTSPPAPPPSPPAPPPPPPPSPPAPPPPPPAPPPRRLTPQPQPLLLLDLQPHLPPPPPPALPRRRPPPPAPLLLRLPFFAGSPSSPAPLLLRWVVAEVVVVDCGGGGGRWL